MSQNFGVRPMEDYPALVEEALAVLRDKEQPWWKRSKAERLLHEASLQALPVVHQHLDEIFELALNPTSAHECFPWRESGLLHFDYLKRVVLDETRQQSDRVSAWSNLMETRHPEALRFAESTADDLDIPFEPSLQWVGYHKQGDLYKPLYTEPPFHLHFSDDYLAQLHKDRSWETNHPTWHLPTINETPQLFGGSWDAECSICGGSLHHLITLNPIPAALNISGLSSLTLAVCLSCLGWNWDVYKYLFYEHDSVGHPRHIGYEGERIEPEFPAHPIRETFVHLSDGGARWRWQLCSGNGNVFRVGGFPTWVQDSDYPLCIGCQQPMRFLIQLDSGLPTEGAREWQWGGWGLGYGMWCDECRISAYLLQWS